MSELMIVAARGTRFASLTRRLIVGNGSLGTNLVSGNARFISGGPRYITRSKTHTQLSRARRWRSKYSGSSADGR